MPSLFHLTLHPRPSCSCKEALDRFEWRHNNIVHYLYSTLSSQRLEGVEVYADLEGLRVNGVTIPPDLAVSAQKPDLVKRKSKEVKLVELTVPWDSSNNMAAAVQRKTDRYQGLSTEIMSNGYKCDNTPLEVGTRGMINQRNRAVITNLCHDMKIKKAHMGPTAKNANIVQKSLYILSLGRASEIIVNCVEEKINKH